MVSGDWRSGIKEIRMAVSGSNDDPRMVKQRNAYQARLSAATGLPVKLYESSDYNGVIQAMSSGQVDLAQMAGGGYANVDSQIGKLAAPILTLRQAEGRPATIPPSSSAPTARSAPWRT
uniref:PhnD/SsuA/transferrin family substrate-binding protein n=1 Tax=Phenylobacterium glaciei TaxID=2803784 RepID=A0A974S959_9CAUL|nr:PhnD/SsuA/transferrin family substrate-binding protein [Phenylobacterium glaciei]